jgi:hypothetical protein
MVPAITTGVDPNADPKLSAESLGDQTMNQNSGIDSGAA